MSNNTEDEVRVIMKPSEDGDPVLLKKLIETMREIGREALNK